jgi:hypothetical protein
MSASDYTFEDFTDNQEDDMKIKEQLRSMRLGDYCTIGSYKVTKVRHVEFHAPTARSVGKELWRVEGEGHYYQNHKIEPVARLLRTGSPKKQQNEPEVIENPSPEDLEDEEWYWVQIKTKENVGPKFRIGKWQRGKDKHGRDRGTPDSSPLGAFTKGCPFGLYEIKRVQKIPRPDWD